MAFGITSAGFSAKRLEDIKDEIKDAIEQTFGTTVNLDDVSPFGQLVSIFSERESLLWELAEDIYNSQYPFGAESASLDFVASITGTVRKVATKSTVTLKIFGVIGTIIPLGSIAAVENSTTARFETLALVVIGAGTDENQTITYASLPNAGSYTLDFDGQVTGAIQWDDTSGDIQTALLALSNLTDVIVSGTKETFFTVQFQNDDGSLDQPLITVSTNGLQSLEVTEIDTVADVSQSLHRTFFTLYDSVGSVDFWLNINNQLGATKNPNASDRDVEITTVNEDDDADTVATKIAAAIDAEPGGEFTGSSSTNTITATATVVGARTDSDAGDSGFTVSTANQGQNPGSLVINILESIKGQLPNVEVASEAITAGLITAAAGAITFIETPVTGWDTVTNVLLATTGRNRETDPELKIRRDLELAIAGKSTTNAIFAAISQITDVTGVVVFENDTDVANPDPVLDPTTKAIRDVIFLADVSQSLHTKYFTIYQFEGAVDVWYNINNQGGAAKTANASYRDIEITTVDEDDDADTVALKTAAVLNLDAEFIAIDGATDDEKRITNVNGSKLPDSVTGISSFTVTNISNGLNSLPPHSVEATVQGGSDADISESIFETVAAGIGTVGDTLVSVQDDQGFSQSVRFSRPVEIEIYCTWDLSIDSSLYPVGGDSLVIEATVAFGNGLGIGKDIIINPELIAGALGEIPGITDSIAKVDVTAAPTATDNIVVDPNEITLWANARVIVNIIATI